MQTVQQRRLCLNGNDVIGSMIETGLRGRFFCAFSITSAAKLATPDKTKRLAVLEGIIYDHLF